eukprot:TRINITY_DN1550_c0_g1_i1.p1 TRINITY_DN1550_c0_g1~~TRINITY_DN1550_c0_g1_i1.p1  ORF type:complete len:679 (+),score=277.85 TRINITY_DN1550_c0_g1_i1:93-2039(+)
MSDDERCDPSEPTAVPGAAHEKGSACDAVNPLPFVRELRNDFGGEFMIMLFCTYFGVKGMLSTVLGQVQIPFYRDYMPTSGADYQKYTTFASTPWALKAMFGAISDSVPIRGYHKVPYMIAATFLGAGAYVALWLMPVPNAADAPDAANATLLTVVSGILLPSNGTLAPLLEDGSGSDDGGTPPSGLVYLAPVLFCLCNLQIAVVDLLTEGRYAAMMVAKPETGSSLVTWVWACIFIGSLVASGFVGPVSDSYGVPLLFIIAIPLSLQVLVPLCKGFMKEERDEQAAVERTCSTAAVKTDKIRAQWRMYVLAGVMTLGALCNSISALFLSDETTSLIVTYCWCTVIVLTSFWALSPPMAKAITYMFLCNALYVRIPGALDSWYTRDEGCVPGGPHFDNTYYLTYSGIVGSFAALGGVALFQKFFQNSTFRRAFWLTTVLKIIASVFDVVIVKRWHRPHVSDHFMYMFGDAAIGEVVGQLDFMPAVVLVSKLCPPGYESLVYAMLAGFQNFGFQVARHTGLFLMKAMNVYAEPAPSTDCNWDNLAELIIVSHMVLPLITVPLTFVLLPNARLKESVIEECDVLNEGADAALAAAPPSGSPPPRRASGTFGFGQVPDRDPDQLFSSDEEDAEEMKVREADGALASALPML